MKQSYFTHPDCTENEKIAIFMSSPDFDGLSDEQKQSSKCLEAAFKRFKKKMERNRKEMIACRPKLGDQLKPLLRNRRSH